MVAQFVLDPADFTARGINGEKVAAGESTDLARLLHESGEWYGWASQAEVTKDSHPWLLEYDEEAACNRDLHGRPYMFVHVFFVSNFVLLDSPALFAFYCLLLFA